MDLKRTTDLVKHLLETIPATRNSDDILYLEACKARCRNIRQVPFGIVMANRDAYNLPSYESVGRARRKSRTEGYSYSRGMERGTGRRV